MDMSINSKSNVIGYALCTVMLSLIYALIGQIALSAPTGYNVINKLTVLVIGISGVLAYVIESIFQNYLDLRSTYKTIFAVIATGLLFLPFFGERYWIAFNIIVVLSFYLFFLRFILLIPMAYAKSGTRGIATFALVAGLAFGVSLVGVLIGAIFTETGGYSLVALLSIVFGSIYLISIGLLPLVKRTRRVAVIDVDDADWDETKLHVQRDMETLHSSVERSIEKPLWSLSRGELGGLCDSFGNHYRLTKREREILPLILGGRTSTEISDILILSQSTIKGHTRTLYRKCNVHSKSELLSTFERDRLILDL